VYEKSVELAEQTYKQSSDVWGGAKAEQQEKRDPVNGTTYVDQEENK
jgi:hypothetical protein